MQATMPDIATMTVAQYQARIIEKCAHFLAHFVMHTAEDRLRWRPAFDENSKTRSVLEQIGECIFANERFVYYLRDETPPPAPAELDDFASAEEAASRIRESGIRLAEIVARLTAEDLA